MFLIFHRTSIWLLSFFSNDLTSGGDMGLKNGGCQDCSFELFYSSFKRAIDENAIIINIFFSQHFKKC